MGFFKACKGCGSRFHGCHSQCDKYKREKAEYDRLKNAESQKKETARGLYDQRTSAIKKAQRHWRDWR